MLYHVTDLDRGLSELVRVLRPGGRLVAITNGNGHLAEMWALLGVDQGLVLPFRRENGGEILRPYFAGVIQHDLRSAAVFDDRAALEAYVGTLRPDLVERLPEVEVPFHVVRDRVLHVHRDEAAVGVPRRPAVPGVHAAREVLVAEAERRRPPQRSRPARRVGQPELKRVRPGAWERRKLRARGRPGGSQRGRHNHGEAREHRGRVAG
jgi:SAM-dependent methyltransferase